VKLLVASIFLKGILEYVMCATKLARIAKEVAPLNAPAVTKALNCLTLVLAQRQNVETATAF
jgi:hypothetical protein